MAKSVLQRLHGDDTRGVVLLLLPDDSDRVAAAEWLTEAGYEVIVADDAAAARTVIEERLDLVVAVLDHRLTRGEGLLDAAADSPAGLEVVLAGPADVFDVTRALAEGAVSFLPHPITQANLISQVALARHAAQQAERREQLRLSEPQEVSFEGIVGVTQHMVELMRTLKKAAPTDAPVVILGETGTGKELVARAIHDNSRRRKGPFVALHLHATPQGLVESELFGHKKGSFTGAVADRVGKLELADGGTLFLDELGDIPLETQAKLLRVLETQTFEPVGANRSVSSDFRLIGATNLDIEQMIAEKKFREELWHRIKVVRVDLPPLRERRADIPLLVERFIAEYAARYGKQIDGIERDALALLSRHPWSSGNIRELRNAIHRMVVLADGPRLTVQDVPREVRGWEPGEGPTSGALAGRTMDEIERDAIRETLNMTDGNRKAAAELLQIGERTLYRKIKEYDL